MVNFNDHQSVIGALRKVQSNEKDQRDLSRECTTFITKKDGQWQPEVLRKMKGRPRFTLDRCSPVIDMIAGEMERSQFNAKVKPAGGNSTKDDASRYEALIRSIQSWSNAHLIYKKAARRIIVQGFDAWEVSYDYIDGDTFDKDLMIKPIHNAIDRVWFDPGSEEQDGSDSRWAVKLQAISVDDYKEQWPDEDLSSVETGNNDYNYSNKRSVVVVGKLYYKKEVSQELVLMSNGDIYKDDEIASIKDELEAAGITEKARRKRKTHEVKARFFNGEKFLGKEFDTPFEWIPIIPVYHGFDIVEDKKIWRRIIEKMMDSQRIYNYSKSREIEEGALSPRGKIFMTRKQAEGHEQQIKTLNTNPDPVQFYNHDTSAPPPFYMGGPQVNPSLANISAGAEQDIEAISGMYAASMAKNPQNQSGVALQIQEQRGSMGNSSFYKDMEIAVTHTCRILVKAIPKVYDAMREVSFMNEDGSTSMEEINKVVIDRQTQRPVTLNDMTSGVYDVVCEMGAMYRTQQEQANQALMNAAAAIPGLMETNADIFLGNINAPNMESARERVRRKLFNAGEIPEDQWTEEEKEAVQQAAIQAQENQQPDPVTMQTLATLQAQQQDLLSQAEARIMEQQRMMMEENRKLIETIAKANKMDADTLNTDADTLNKIREASGADAVINSNTAEAYNNQALKLANNSIQGENDLVSAPGTTTGVINPQ